MFGHSPMHTGTARQVPNLRKTLSSEPLFPRGSRLPHRIISAGPTYQSLSAGLRGRVISGCPREPSQKFAAG